MTGLERGAFLTGTSNFGLFQKRVLSFTKLGLKSETEWRAYVKSGQKPTDIPASPSLTYAKDGWVGVGDWLGTGAVHGSQRQYWSFGKARAFVHDLGLKSQTDWWDFCQSGDKPIEIPSNPQQKYANDGWTGYGDWLGTGAIASRLREYRSFEEARAFVRGLKLKSRAEWDAYVKSGQKPIDIPATPDKTYTEVGWAGLGNWLGTGIVATHLREYRPFKEARAFVHSLGLKTRAEWHTWTKSGKKPNDIPSSPDNVYANQGWAGMGDWLGTGTISNSLREYRSFEEARAFVQSLGLKSETEWRAYRKSGKKPNDIPANPNRTYAEDGWAGVGDWLGTGTIAPRLREYRPFKEARAFVHSLKLKSNAEWRAYRKSGKKPTDIPAGPDKTYAEVGWVGWGDWLGYERSGRRSEARSKNGTSEPPAPADVSP